MIPQDDTVITIADVRDAGYCVSGCKQWLAMRGFDFRSFVKSGLTYGELKHIDDAILSDIIAKKRERADG